MNLDEVLNSVNQYLNDNPSKPWKPGVDWVQYSGPYFTNQEYLAATKTLLGKWLGIANDTIKFEKQFSKLFNQTSGVLVNSGSSANLLMMSALTSKRCPFQFPAGTKVIAPVAGFPTTVNPIIQCGFDPIFIDIELDTLNLDLDKLEDQLIKDKNIRIITFAHVLGNPPDMDRLMDLVRKYKLIFLEDTCDSLGSLYNNKALGSFGLMSSCSFYPAHHITLGEGGIVCTSNPELERIIRSFREWGRDCYCTGKASFLKDGTCGKRFSNWVPGYDKLDHKYIYSEIGYNLKPIELQASIGLAQLEKVDEITAKRRHNYRRIKAIFDKYGDKFKVIEATKNSDPSWFAIPIICKNVDRFNFCTHLEDNKIQTRQFFAGNILLQPGYNHLGCDDDYPNATSAMFNVFFLGTSPVITDEQIDYIESIVNEYFRQ